MLKGMWASDVGPWGAASYSRRVPALLTEVVGLQRNTILGRICVLESSEIKGQRRNLQSSSDIV